MHLDFLLEILVLSHGQLRVGIELGFCVVDGELLFGRNGSAIAVRRHLGS